MSTAGRRSPVISLICALLAVVCVIGAIFYWTQSTSLFAGSPGIHHKHAVVLAVLAVLFLLAAILFRPRRRSAF